MLFSFSTELTASADGGRNSDRTSGVGKGGETARWAGAVKTVFAGFA
jgi:hypothetical protein